MAGTCEAARRPRVIRVSKAMLIITVAECVQLGGSIEVPHVHGVPHRHQKPCGYPDTMAAIYHPLDDYTSMCCTLPQADASSHNCTCPWKP